MAVETELKLCIPPGAVARLRRHPLLAGIRPQRQRLANTYYDTPALDLRRSKIALRHRRMAWGFLLTVKSAEPAAGGLARRNEWEAPSQPGAFDFSHVDDKTLRTRLAAMVPMLQPAFTTDFLRTTWLVSYGGASIELALDRGEVRCGSAGNAEVAGRIEPRIEPICELELELLSGPTSALFDLALALQETLPLRPAVASKAERGFRLFLDEPLKPFRAGASQLSGEAAPRAAFCAVAFDCIEHLQRNEPGLNSEQPEFLHQARVAIRRLRTAMRFWAPVLPPHFLETFDPSWQALAQLLGEQRNLDVFAGHTLPPLKLRFPDRGSLRRLEAAAGRRRADARKAVRAAIEHPAYARLLLQFVAAISALAEDEADALVATQASDVMTSFARMRLQRFAKTVRRRGEATGSDPEAHHRLRIAFKRLRYALEFCAPLFHRKRLRRYLSAAAEMQEVLGDMNDLAVTSGILGDLKGGGNDPLLTGWFEGRAALLNDLLPGTLSAFADARPPWRK